MKKKVIAILLLIVQFFFLCTSGKVEQANVQEVVQFYNLHQCDSLVEYLETGDGSGPGWWSYKVIYYVYYLNAIDGQTYPCFCIEPEDNGIGMGYDSYKADVSKETDPVIWRILYHGYMGRKYTDYDLMCDDDLYSATKIALHCYKDGVAPYDKYIVGNRPTDGNSVEVIQARGQKVLDLAQQLYLYGIYNQEDSYQEPQATILPEGKETIQTIQGKDYLVRTFRLQGNREIQNYQIETTGLPEGSQVLTEGSKITVKIPTKEIQQDIQATLHLQKIEMKTLPIYLCKSHVDEAQDYVTYASAIETTEAEANLTVDAEKASLEIQKVDSETGEPLEGVQFAITDNTGKSLGIYETDKKGKVLLENMAPQVVWVQEITTKEGYILSTEKQKVTLEWGKVSTLVWDNHKIPEEPEEPEIPEEPVEETPPLPRTGY